MNTDKKKLVEIISYNKPRHSLEIDDEERIADVILSSGFIHRGSVELDEEKIFNMIWNARVDINGNKLGDYTQSKYIERLAHAIATQKGVIK